MLFKSYCLFVVAVICSSCFGGENPSKSDYPQTFHPPFYRGTEADGLQPVLKIERGYEDWSIEVLYVAQADFAGNAWLRVTNRVGSKIQVMETNGVERSLRDTSAAAAWQIPVETTVSNVMYGVERPRRILQWWKTGLTNSVAGKLYSSTTFHLEPLYGAPFTNDCFLLMSPLMYKVNTNGEACHLVEFPVIVLKLNADGTVEKLDSPTTK